MIGNEVQQLEFNIKRSKEIADIGAAFERLRNTRDFKTVISGGYFEREAIRLVHLKADSNMQSADSQKAIMLQIDAIGSLSQYFNTLTRCADMANKSIESDEQTLAELHLEALL